MIYVLRHADSVGQSPDAPLSETGRRQAEALVPRLAQLGIGHVTCSPYARCRETAAPFLAQSGVAVAFDDRLRERTHGDVPPDAWDRETDAMFADLDAEPFGGESLNAAADRGQAAVMEAAGPTPLIVSHGLLMSVTLARYGRPLTIACWRAMPRPALFAIEDGQCRELRVN
jgi:2,3-bisphosphoglycerate-dependent phosphoglycerate mutase